MIKLELTWDGKPQVYLGTVHHSKYGVAAGIHWDYKSTLATRRYMCGLEPPNYPVPAIRYELLVIELEPKFMGYGAVVLVKERRNGGLSLVDLLYCTED